uniref:Uncharacterized protein n=1 Tax=Zea mays TaxID=4577 RepID=A0A804LSS1_MAIZE
MLQRGIGRWWEMVEERNQAPCGIQLLRTGPNPERRHLNQATFAGKATGFRDENLLGDVKIVIHLQDQLEGAIIVSIQTVRVDLKYFSSRREAATDRGLRPLLWREVSEGHQSQPLGCAGESEFDPSRRWEEFDADVGTHRLESGVDEGRNVGDSRRVIKEGERQAVLEKQVTLRQPSLKEVISPFPGGDVVAIPRENGRPGGAKRKGGGGGAEEARTGSGVAGGGGGERLPSGERGDEGCRPRWLFPPRTTMRTSKHWGEEMGGCGEGG